MAVYRKPPAAPGRPPAPATLAYQPEQLTRAPGGHAGFAAVLAGFVTGLAFAAAGLQVAALPAMALASITTWRSRRREVSRPRVVLTVRGDVLEVTLGDGAALFDSPLEDVLDVTLDTRTIERIIDHPELAPVPMISHSTVAPPVEESRIDIVTKSRVVPLTNERFSHSDSLEWRGKIRQFLRKHGWEAEHEREGYVAPKAKKKRAREQQEPAPTAPPRVEPARLGGWLWLWPIALVAYPLVTMRALYDALHAFEPVGWGSAWWMAEHLAPEVAVRMAVAVGLGSLRVGLLVVVIEATHRKLGAVPKLVFALAGATLVEGVALTVLPSIAPLDPRAVLPYFAWALPWLAYFRWAKRPAATFAAPGRPQMWLQAGGVAAILLASFAVHTLDAPGPMEMLPRSEGEGVVTASIGEELTARFLATPAFQGFYREQAAPLRAAGTGEDAIRGKVFTAFHELTYDGYPRLDEAKLDRVIALEEAMLSRVGDAVCAGVWRGTSGGGGLVGEGLLREELPTWVDLKMAAFEAGRRAGARPERVDLHAGRELILSALDEQDAATLRASWQNGALDDRQACWAQRKADQAARRVEPARRLEALRWLVSPK